MDSVFELPVGLDRIRNVNLYRRRVVIRCCRAYG